MQIELLDGNDITRSLYKRTKTKEILENIFQLLNIIEKDYFGLYYTHLETDDRVWLKPNSTIWSQIVKLFDPPYQLYFGVKYYPYDPLLLQEDITLYMMYLQLRREVKDGKVVCSEVERAEMLSYILQAEGGDHGEKYIHKHRNFFVNLQRSSPDLENAVLKNYKELKGIDPATCEMKVMEKALTVTYYDQEVYHVRSEAQPGLRRLTLTLGPIGIGIYQNTTKLDIFGWMEIWNVGYINHTFWFRIVRDGEKSKHKFHFENSKVCEHVWKAFRNFFQFYTQDRKVDPRLLWGRVPPRFERVTLFTEQKATPLKQIVAPKISQDNISGLTPDPVGNSNKILQDHYRVKQEKTQQLSTPDKKLTGSGKLRSEKGSRSLEHMFDNSENSTNVFLVSGHTENTVESITTPV